MKQILNDSPATHGLLGGSFTGLLVNLNSSDMLRTSALAALGTIVSFSLSLLLHMLVHKRRK